MTQANLNRRSLRWSVALICLLVGGIIAMILLRGSVGSSPPVAAHPDGGVPATLRQLLQEGRAEQLKQNWPSARAIYEDLQQRLATSPAANAEFGEDVTRNLEMLKVLSPSDPASYVATEVPPKKQLPQKLTEDVLASHYPAGKTIRSRGHFQIQGKGHNTAWGIRGAVSFVYQSVVEVETRVAESDPLQGRLVFEQTFGNVLQVRAVASRSLELVPPDSPTIRYAWPHTDFTLRQISPGYREFRKAAEMINNADPGLKRVLTLFGESLRLAGVQLHPDDDAQFARQVEKLTGTKLKIVYLSGLGVTSISQLDGKHRFDRQELIRLAHASTVMMDQFVMPVAQTREGESWEVRPEDVGNLVALYDPSIELSGRLQLRRAVDDRPESLARLELEGGTVEARGEGGGQSREGRMAIRGGHILFDLTRHFVDRAVIRFSVQSLLQSRDHLLFGTDQLRDLNVESQYEAQFVDPEDPPSTRQQN